MNESGTTGSNPARESRVCLILHQNIAVFVLSAWSSVKVQQSTVRSSRRARQWKALKTRIKVRVSSCAEEFGFYSECICMESPFQNETIHNIRTSLEWRLDIRIVRSKLFCSLYHKSVYAIGLFWIYRNCRILTAVKNVKVLKISGPTSSCHGNAKLKREQFKTLFLEQQKGRRACWKNL